MKNPWPWVDRRNRIVIRGRRAVALSVLEFAIFNALHRIKLRDGPYKVRITRELVDEVYAGVSDPPLLPQRCVLLTAKKMNGKLAHLGMSIRAVNRRHNSFYRLQDLS